MSLPRHRGRRRRPRRAARPVRPGGAARSLCRRWCCPPSPWWTPGRAPRGPPGRRPPAPLLVAVPGDAAHAGRRRRTSPPPRWPRPPWAWSRPAGHRCHRAARRRPAAGERDWPWCSTRPAPASPSAGCARVAGTSLLIGLADQDAWTIAVVSRRLRRSSPPSRGCAGTTPGRSSAGRSASRCSPASVAVLAGLDRGRVGVVLAAPPSRSPWPVTAAPGVGGPLQATAVDPGVAGLAVAALDPAAFGTVLLLDGILVARGPAWPVDEPAWWPAVASPPSSGPGST